MRQRSRFLLSSVLCYCFACIILNNAFVVDASSASHCPTKEELTKILQPLDENSSDQAGWGFLRTNTFRASTMVQAPQGERTALSAELYYYHHPDEMSTNASSINGGSGSIESLDFVRLKSDQTLNYHMGNAITIFQIGNSADASDAARIVQLGRDVLAGDVVQWTIPAGTWYSLLVNEGNHQEEDDNNARTGAFALIGSAVAPGREEQDQEVANTAELSNVYPEAVDTITSWLNNNDSWTPNYCESLPPRPSVDRLVDLYGLEPHPEGGHFLETYRSAKNVVAPWGNRTALTAIYYLMVSTEESGKSNFHRLKSDETWSYYYGDPILLYMLNTDVESDMETIVLGTNLTAGEVVQFTVPAGVWFGAEVLPGGSISYAFGGTHVGPGFEFADWELGTGSELAATYPEAEETIRRLTPPEQEEEEAGNEEEGTGGVEGATNSQESVEQSQEDTDSNTSGASMDLEMNASSSPAFAAGVLAVPRFAAPVLLPLLLLA